MGSRPTFWIAVVLVFAVLAGACGRRAHAIDRTFSGSAQFDYFFDPSEPKGSARSIGFDGFTTEAALKLAVDFSSHVSMNVKVCYGCHGFEADMAYLDYRAVDEFNVRIGRFSPSFGSFNIRHDPGNHGTSDKPLPYDMGRMLRYPQWNLGVLPAPFPDNGIEIGGTHQFGTRTQGEYAIYAVSGFKGDEGGFDLNFVESRTPSLYYIDNNSRPTVGGRLAVTTRFAPRIEATLGASGMSGTFDPQNLYTYTIFGGDLSLRLKQTNVRVEYLARRQEFAVTDPSQFKYYIPVNGDFFVKHGAYVEVEHPITRVVTVIGRADGLFRIGNVAADSELRRQSSVGRLTYATTFAVERGVKIKASTELWQFSDPDAAGRTRDIAFHLGVVGLF